jgi:hypothetical protein
MRYSMTHLAGSVLLSAVMTGSALGQNLGSASTATNQLQGLQHSAIKMAEVGAGVGLGMTVIGLALHARHHRSKQAASNVDYKALSEEYARQLRDMQARSLMPAAGVPAAGPARTAAQGAETTAPAVLPLPAQAANVAPPATPATPRP